MLLENVINRVKTSPHAISAVLPDERRYLANGSESLMSTIPVALEEQSWLDGKDETSGKTSLPGNPPSPLRLCPRSGPAFDSAARLSREWHCAILGDCGRLQWGCTARSPLGRGAIRKLGRCVAK